jgi:four helix bundle protein
MSHWWARTVSSAADLGGKKIQKLNPKDETPIPIRAHAMTQPPTAPPTKPSRIEGADGGVPYDLSERLFLFAVGVVKVVRTFPRTTEGIETGKQLFRAGTSAAANFEEANASQSKRPFVAKACIARKEASESRFWLRLAAECEMGDETRARDLHLEADQLVRILSTMIMRARDGS